MSRVPLSTTLLTLALSASLSGCGADEPAPDESAMTATAETETGVEAPAFTVAARTEFQPREGMETPARGTLRLLVPNEDPDGPPTPVRVRVELAGLDPGFYAWNIYGGSCEVTTPPVAVPLSGDADTEGIAPPLEVGMDSTVVAEVEVPPLRALWVEAGNYSVRVYDDINALPGSALACAVL